MMHQSEFDTANVALSQAADKRKSLINIHKNWYTATLSVLEVWRLLVARGNTMLIHGILSAHSRQRIRGSTQFRGPLLYSICEGATGGITL